jgi:hypothetical protein
MKNRILYSISVCLILLVIAGATMELTDEESWVNKINLFWTVASLEILYFLASLKSIGPEEKGLLLVFGEPIENVE